MAAIPVRPSSDALRIVSWNIHGSVGGDGRCDPERILAHLRAIDPDILALQEVDGRTHFGRMAGAFEFFAAALGGFRVEARMVQRPGRDYGHLLWSRWPIAVEAAHRLPGGRIEPRGVIDAVIAAPTGPLRVLSTHFGLWPGDRRRQASWVARLVYPEGGTAEVPPTIALGDFNEWRTAGAVHKALSAVLPVFANPVTWPSRRPFVRMDRLYASEGVVLSAMSTAAEAAGASDHLPLVIDLVLPPAG